MILPENTRVWVNDPIQTTHTSKRLTLGIVLGYREDLDKDGCIHYFVAYEDGPTVWVADYQIAGYLHAA